MRLLRVFVLFLMLLLACGPAYMGVCQAYPIVRENRDSADTNPGAFFNKSVYYPDVSVFWNRSARARHTDSGGVWYEEYADVGAPSSRVLNGFVFALFGLFEYSFETGNSQALKLFWEGTRTLSLNLYRYDTGSGSYYDLLHQEPAGLNYQRLHVRQLSTLFKITGDPIFQEYCDRFNSYIK